MKGEEVALITEEYRKLNSRLHESTIYGAGGHRWAGTVTKLRADFECVSVLDYGCGRGTLAEALDFPIREYDPALPAKSARPEPADLVVCTDVLEHIEPDCLYDVLSDLERLTKKVILLNISTRPAIKFLEDGRNAHLIVANIAFWHNLIFNFLSPQTWEVGKDELTAICTPYERRSLVNFDAIGHRFLIAENKYNRCEESIYSTLIKSQEHYKSLVGI